jgi:hypothetical protein
MPPGPGRGLAAPALAAPWTPAKLGSAFVAELLAAGATLSGSNITALANPLGTAGALVSGATSCTLDSSALIGGKGAISTSSTSSDLHVLTGGPMGNNPFAIYVLAQPISQGGAGQQNTNFFTLGNPGNDGTHKPYGIGVLAASNGAYMRVGGFGSTGIDGNSTLPLMAFDAKIRLFELVSTGSLVSFSGDGGLLASLATAVTLDSSGRIGFSGPYPAANYGPSPTRIYGAWVFNRVLTSAERALFLAYAARKFAYTPALFISTLGDSRTLGSIGGANTTSYGAQMVAQYAALGTPVTAYFKNDGVSSQTTAQIAARVTSGFYNYFAPRGFRRQCVILRGRTNDPGAGITSAQGYANLAGASALLRAQGIQTIISTEHSCTAYVQSDRDVVAAYNALALAGVASGDFDGVADIRALIPNYATVSPSTFYLPDGTHQSDALLASEATVDRAAIAALP